MNKKKYQQLVEELTPKENKLANMLVAFIIGGIIGLISNFIYSRMLIYYRQDLAISFTLLILIVITAFFTALGCADNLFSKLKCGLIIPITGFAHSVASCIIDYKREGFLNMGSNTFKLAGSVLLNGIVFAIILTLVKVVLNG